MHVSEAGSSEKQRLPRSRQIPQQHLQGSEGEAVLQERGCQVVVRVQAVVRVRKRQSQALLGQDPKRWQVRGLPDQKCATLTSSEMHALEWIHAMHVLSYA